MKNRIFILASIIGIFSFNTLDAATIHPKRVEYNFNYNDAVNFFERGIEFFVFTNGDFDFDTSQNYHRGIRIERDFRGRIRNVGNVFINYDRFGNVTRIGSIFINYHRGMLASVGDLRVFYDRFGNPVFRGNVNDFYYENGIRFSVNFGRVYHYNDSFFSNRDFDRNYTRFREDNQFYYYKSNSNNNLNDDNAIIKRRKMEVDNNNRREISRNINSYRKSDLQENSRREIEKNVDDSIAPQPSENRRIITDRTNFENRNNAERRNEDRKMNRRN